MPEVDCDVRVHVLRWLKGTTSFLPLTFDPANEMRPALLRPCDPHPSLVLSSLELPRDTGRDRGAIDSPVSRVASQPETWPRVGAQRHTTAFCRISDWGGRLARRVPVSRTLGGKPPSSIVGHRYLVRGSSTVMRLAIRTFFPFVTVRLHVLPLVGCQGSARSDDRTYCLPDRANQRSPTRGAVVPIGHLQVAEPCRSRRGRRTPRQGGHTEVPDGGGSPGRPAVLSVAPYIYGRTPYAS